MAGVCRMQGVDPGAAAKMLSSAALQHCSSVIVDVIDFILSSLASIMSLQVASGK